MHRCGGGWGFCKRKNFLQFAVQNVPVRERTKSLHVLLQLPDRDKGCMFARGLRTGNLLRRSHQKQEGSTYALTVCFLTWSSVSLRFCWKEKDRIQSRTVGNKKIPCHRRKRMMSSGRIGRSGSTPCQPRCSAGRERWSSTPSTPWRTPKATTAKEVCVCVQSARERKVDYAREPQQRSVGMT